MWIQRNLHYHEPVMPVILSLFIKSTFSRTAWKSVLSTSRRAKQMSLHMQHKGLIHAWEILLPIFEMPLIQNITQPLMVVFIGSPICRPFTEKKKNTVK